MPLATGRILLLTMIAFPWLRLRQREIDQRFPKNLISEKYTEGRSDDLHYIHIGKCGGATVWKAIQKSPVVKSKFTSTKKIHLRKPFYQKNSNYIMVLRNPISRAISAFNWRYKLVVETKEQEFRFPGEFEILEKYRTINNFAENLYANGALDLAAVKEWQTVHHLKEDIDFYLAALLERVRPQQIFAVLVQEFLNDDIANMLGVKSIASIHENTSGMEKNKLGLSDVARDNLGKFLASDYSAIRKLSHIHPIDDDKLSVLLR